MKDSLSLVSLIQDVLHLRDTLMIQYRVTFNAKSYAFALYIRHHICNVITRFVPNQRIFSFILIVFSMHIFSIIHFLLSHFLCCNKESVPSKKNWYGGKQLCVFVILTNRLHHLGFVSFFEYEVIRHILTHSMKKLCKSSI